MKKYDIILFLNCLLLSFALTACTNTGQAKAQLKGKDGGEAKIEKADKQKNKKSISKEKKSDRKAVNLAEVKESSDEDSANPAYNNNFFIKVGGKVYFRKESEKAIDTDGLFGEYRTLGNDGKVSSLYLHYNEPSSIMSVDIKTGKIAEEFQDKGSGKLSYYEGRFYSTLVAKDMTNKNGSYIPPVYKIYSVDKDGSDYKEVGDGALIGISGGKLISAGMDATAYNKIQVSDIAALKQDNYRIKDTNTAQIAVSYERVYLFPEGILYCSQENDADKVYFYSYKNSQSVYLGTLQKNIQEGDDSYYGSYAQIKRAALNGNNLCLICEFKEGSGGFYMGAIAYTADITKDSSLNKQNTTGRQEEFTFVISKEGNPVSAKYLPDYPYASDNKLYTVNSQESAEERACDFAGKYLQGSGISRSIDVLTVIDGEVYGIINTYRYNNDLNIGWRYGTVCLKSEYFKADLNNPLKQKLAETVYKDNLTLLAYCKMRNDNIDSQGVELIYMPIVVITENDTKLRERYSGYIPSDFNYDYEILPEGIASTAKSLYAAKLPYSAGYKSMINSDSAALYDMDIKSLETYMINTGKTTNAAELGTADYTGYTNTGYKEEETGFGFSPSSLMALELDPDTGNISSIEDYYIP